MTIDKGYAVCMQEALNYIYTMTPNKEEINGAFRETKYAYPPTAIREVLANALIHQDFSATGKSSLSRYLIPVSRLQTQVLRLSISGASSIIRQNQETRSFLTL